MLPKLETVLFDLDGTLVDTNELIIQSFLRTFNDYFPGRYTREAILPYMGEPLHKQMARVAPDRVEELTSTYISYNLSLHDELIRPFPNVGEVIKELSEAGVNMGVVTTKRRKTAELSLRAFGLERYLSILVAYEDVKEHKPAPEPIAKGISLADADPRTTLYVGDSPYDIQAAHAAGTKAAGVAWSLRGSAYLQQFTPDFLLHDMRDLYAIIGKQDLNSGVK